MAEFSKTSETFEKLYRALNPAQKKAVDTIDGPVVVIAGPGTGKTQILALRIANILRQTDTPADAILALAFTESAVHSMRRRLVSIIGTPAYKIPIFTFHGLANNIIERFPEAFPRIIGSMPAADIDQIDILTEIIENAADPIIRPYGNPLHYLEPIRGVLRELKRENIGPADLKKMIAASEATLAAVPESDRLHQKGAHKGKVKSQYVDEAERIAKNKALVDIYAAYEQALAKRRLYDFEDMIREVVTTLGKNSDLLLRLQEQYQYLLADEHQYVNAAQNTFLELLASFHENPNLFIVGDEKQAIFRFQGASLDTFLYFKTRYPQATVISLEENYRSTQPILDAAHGLISNNPIVDPALGLPLRAVGDFAADVKLQPAITLHHMETPRHELDFLATELARRLTENPEASIAVIYRTNGDAADIVRALTAAKVPYSLHSSRDIFTDAAIANFILLARTLTHYGDDALLGRLLYADFLRTTPLDVFKIIRYAATQSMPIADVISSMSALTAAGVANPETFTALAERLSDLARFVKNHDLLESLNQVLYDSNFLPYVLATPNAPRTLAALETLTSEAKKIARNVRNGASLDDFIRFIDTAIEHKVPVDVVVPVAERNGGIQLMTAHKSKGFEFETVFIVGAGEGHWGGRRSRTHFHIFNKQAATSAEEDERRLFYVALTRAKREIIISFAATDEAGKSRLPSQFVTELDPALVTNVTIPPLPVVVPSVTPAASIIPFADSGYVRSLFAEQGWSVSALNNYIKCPWQYFFRNLVRLPEIQTKHQLYGTAVHDTLDQFFRRYDDEQDMTQAEFLALFEKFLHREPLSSIDYQSSLEKGTMALSGWYQSHKKNPLPRGGKSEYKISDVALAVPLVTSEVLQVPLRGKLDRISFINEHDVFVTDFKTAKPQTRNEILGKTKTSSGDYFRQLVFYRLLLDLHDAGRWHMLTGDINFIEPDERGVYHREQFEITDADIVSLKAIIVDASRDIWTGDFWGKTCGDPKCTYCQLRKTFDLS